MSMLFEILDIVRNNILQKLMIPLLPFEVNYWKFSLLVGFVSIIVVAYVNRVKVTRGR